MISLSELKKSRNRVTSIIFLKKSFNMESIIRWLFDRGFSCDNFVETKRFYVFYQENRLTFEKYNYEALIGEEIAIELGAESGEHTATADLDKIIHLNE